MFLFRTILVCIFINKASSSYIRVKPDELIKDEAWEVWKSDRNKQYKDDGEEEVRYTIWKDNLRHIVEHNEKNSKFSLTMNDFGDMTNTEFRATMNGYFQNKDRVGGGSTFLSPSSLYLPDTVDWRIKGYVTPVKQQGSSCNGGSWAFSTTGALEGQHKKKTGTLVSLSEQNLVDCSATYGTYGCRGGSMDAAFEYIKGNKGIDTEASYPYEGKEGVCKYDKGKSEGVVSGYVDIATKDETLLRNATAAIGPISVAIDASKISFQFYHSGVYYEPDCSSTQVNQCALVVGYGALETGKGQTEKYWLVKNSWGTQWGDEGFIKMSRDENNQCGIASQASYPLV